MFIYPDLFKSQNVCQSMGLVSMKHFQIVGILKYYSELYYEHSAMQPSTCGHAAMQTCDVVICYSHSAMQSTTCVLVCSCSLISYCRPAPGPCYSSFAFLLNAYLLMGQEVEMSHVATILHIYILNVHYYVLSRDVPDLITWSEFGDVHAIFKGLESGGKDPDRWFVLKVV